MANPTDRVAVSGTMLSLIPRGDGTLTAIIEIEPQYAVAATAMLGGIGTLVAVARLADGEGAT